jgi:hypothetical protein
VLAVCQKKKNRDFYFRTRDETVSVVPSEKIRRQAQIFVPVGYPNRLSGKSPNPFLRKNRAAFQIAPLNFCWIVGLGVSDFFGKYGMV